MAYELKPGQGTLHRNDKEGNENRPDMRGELNIDGTIYKIAGWTKLGKSGARYLSLKAEIPQEKPADTTKAGPARSKDTDDDIPW
jgi:uncharacterized protein (DUF736 family)